MAYGISAPGATTAAVFASICVFATASGAAAAALQRQQQHQQQQQYIPLNNNDDFYERREAENVPLFLSTDLGDSLRYLKQLQEVSGDETDVGLGGDDMEENEAIRTAMSKRNYQHIWRNVQMRMPVYSHVSQMGQSKRSVRALSGSAVPRHAVNSMYRLG